MATAVNPSTSAGISIGSGLGSVTDWLRQITVRITSSRNSHGSGVIWRSEGLIVTNAHVAGSQVHEIEFENGRRLEAWLLARDQKLDLAVLAVSSRDLQAASIRSARTLRPGEMVIAVGNPLDDVGAVSTGIVHCAVGKLPWVEADIRLAPGNSGGPLADAHGNVVGINSMIVDGLGWAVSSDGVQRFLESVQLAEVV
jgi:serine protease Do